MTKHPYPRLLADVGGTNVRLALIQKAGEPYTDEQNLVCADFPGLYEAVRHYLDSKQIKAQSAAIGIATAVAGDFIRMTNLGWQFSQADLRQALDLDSLVLINDFTALALSLPTLTEGELTQIGGRHRNPDLPIALLGAGTGLGVSGLIPAHRPGEPPHWIPLQGEGGHVSFSPFNHKEDEILRVLRKRFGHVSAERLLSGPGLANLFDAIAEVDGIRRDTPDPAEITRDGLNQSCPLSREVLDTFCGMLGTAAANLTITLGARGGLYIGGGVVPRLGDYFATSPFRSRFEQKGRFSDYLAAVPAFVIHAHNPALRGAAAALEN